MVLHTYERVWIELDRSALIHNLIQLKRAISHAHLAPVIKCNAYGHGLIHIGRVFDERPEVYMMCVAFLSEALQLREVGITKSILVMSYCDDDLAKAVGKNISFVIDSHEEMYAINSVGMQYRYCFDVHIKVDTGLSRRGISPANISSFIIIANQLPYIRIMGVCSHFASAYIPSSPQTALQVDAFCSAINVLASEKEVPPLVHISNSSLISVPGCSMLRVGLALYGYNPTACYLDLKPVLSLKARIVSLRTVDKNTTVGYDGLSITTRRTVIGLVPVGYADGYDMRFSIYCHVSIRGESVPMLGRVGMNFIAVDVTDILGVLVGDEVFLIGDKPGVRVSDLTERSGIKNVREVLARLSPTIPRYLV